MFTHVLCKWPGSSHDSFILKSSDIWDEFESGRCKGIILGDSGYPCKNWLMTPFLNPADDLEKKFNYAQKKTRVLVECAIGRLKRRFGILHQEVRLSLDITPATVITCVILHNIILKQKIRERVMSKYNLLVLPG